MTDIEVHKSHCCVLHGCKYGQSFCPVERGEEEQYYICEDCEISGIKSVAQLKQYMKQEIKSCPYCGHVLD